MKLSLSVYFLLFLACIGGRALRIPNGDVKLASTKENTLVGTSDENTLVGTSDAVGQKIKKGEVARLKPEEVAKVRGSRM